MANEDIIKTWVQDQLKAFGISIEDNNLTKESENHLYPRLYEALVHASKKQTKQRGTTDFAFQIKGKDSNSDYWIIIETKDDTSYDKNEREGQLLFDVKSTQNYAANGAVWYAKQIQKESNLFEHIFAIGISGNYNRQKISSYYVNQTGGIIPLPTSGLGTYTENNIDEFYRVNIEHKVPQSELNAVELKRFASKLHNDIRDYTSLKNSDKAPLIAAILLGIHSKKLSLGDLKGSTGDQTNDGMVIFRAVQDYLDERKKKEPDFDDSKVKPILHEFSLLYTTKALYTPTPALNNHTPLYQFLDDLFSVYNTVKIGDDSDLLGDFYSEFVKYNDSDGSVLGIVLTPHHITGLMADLLEISKEHYLLDPCTGSGAFLVAGMNRMIKGLDKSSPNYKTDFNEIVSHHLLGVEHEPSIYAVAASNMILRGDGKSNMIYGSIFDYKLNKDRGSKDGATTIYGNAPKIDRVLMNPPYSQGKKAPELSFIMKSLELLEDGGELAVIVPISIFVSGGKGVDKGSKNNGKKTSKYKRYDYSTWGFEDYKRAILKDYFVKAIITMNPQSFYPTGTQTVIVIFKKAVGVGQGNKLTKLINFSDDGYSVIPKKGLIPNGTEKEKRDYLIDVVVNDKFAPENFMLKVNLTVDNEWLHNAHYTNPDKPTDADFMNAVADYIVFKQDMKLHGKGYLFDDDSKTNG